MNKIKLQKYKFVVVIFALIQTQTYCYSTNNDSLKLSINQILTKETEPKGFELSINFGSYFANKHHAQYYNGNSTNKNNIDYILKNQYWMDEIKDILRSTINRDSIKGYELPTNMKYKPSIYFGFGLRYNYNSQWALNFQFNHTKLKTQDYFTFEVFPAFDNEFHSYVKYGILGCETRNNIEIGLIHTINKGKIVKPFIEGGILFTNTRVDESKIVIEDREYNLINIYSSQYIPNTQLQETNEIQGGLSFGGYFNAGAKFIFNSFASFEILGSCYYKKINLENYNDYKLHNALMVRLVLSPALFMSKNE